LKTKSPIHNQYRVFAIILLVCAIFATTSSCRDDDFITDMSARLAFSTDSITFDTVFTTIGSITDDFLVFNEHGDPINISRVELAGGEASNFRINVDGEPGTFFTDVEIDRRDSLHVFVEVTVDQNDEALPFVLTDSIMFETNGNLQKITLVAFGQNAIFHTNDTIQGIVDWNDDLPHVIFGATVIPDDATLNINQGVNVFAHAGAVLFVGGELNINGEPDSLVTFQGDRLQSFFDDLPAQWGGIFVVRNENSGGTANINYADIGNTVIGLNVGSSTCDWLDGNIPDGLNEDEQIAFLTEFFGDCIRADNKPTCNINGTTISNSLLSGVASVWSDIDMTNSLIYNCGQNNLQLELGGDFNFNHCTFVNYGSQDLIHLDPVVRCAVFQENLPLQPIPLNANFDNCIIVGGLTEEIDLSEDFLEFADLNASFDHCLVRTERDATLSPFSNTIANPANSDTTFVSRFLDDYHLNDESLARDNGKSTSVTTDLDGVARDASPDIGCYEFQ